MSRRNLGTKVSVIIFSLLCLSSITRVYAENYPPTVILGGYARGVVYSQEEAPADYLGSFDINGLLGWRKPLTAGGYLAVSSSVSLSNYFLGVQQIDDQESLSVEAGLPAGNNTIILGAGFDSSLWGTGIYSEYFRPQWKTKYIIQRGRRKLEPYLAYKGRIFMQPQDIEDVFYQGAQLGFEYRPSVRHGYGLSLEGGWESWYDYPIYEETGDVADQKRNDYLFKLEGTADGLLGYFVDWKLQTALKLRLSNANRYIETETPAVLESNTETSIEGTADFSLALSPTRKHNIQLTPYLSCKYYLERDALAEDGTRTGQNLKIATTGAEVRFDYTTNDEWYLVGKLSGAYRHSNEIFEKGWNISASGGLEYSF
ncbi:MAG: hypothetical protein ACOC7U_09365 [Spirochaetota bacterium]